MAVPSYPAASEARHEDGFLSAKDHLRLYWQRYTPERARGTVAVLPGGGDHGGRYPALTAALVGAGFAVELVDVRGHGQADGRRWHIDAFSDYVGDVEVFMAHVRAGAAGREPFVVAHSQGALVAARWAEDGARGVAGFVLSSPYFRLKFDPPRMKILGARLVGTVIPWLPVSTDLKYADLTSDEEMQRWTEADALYGKATTPRWFTESQRAQAAVVAGAPEFRYPLLVLTGGADRIADAEASAAFVTAAGSEDKELLSYEGLGHEIFNERERDRVFADVVGWLSARCRPSGGLQGSMSSAARE
jgi:alpha-beta hydrolase superfamily lysophospholipase